MLSIPSNIPPLRSVTLSKMEVSANPCANYMNSNNMRNKKVAVAPHTICLMSSGYLAVNRYCYVVAHERMTRVLPETEPDRILREVFRGPRTWRIATPRKHIIDIPPHPQEVETQKVVDWFLASLKLTNIYHIDVCECFDFCGQLAMVPMLTAMWKVLQHFEPKIAKKPMHTAITQTIKHWKLDVPALPAVLKAVDTGSSTFAQVAYGNRKRESVNLSNFIEKYNIIYIRTDLHDKMDDKPIQVASKFWSDTMKESFEYEEVGPTYTKLTHYINAVPNNIRRYSRERLESPNYTPLESEERMQAALGAICDAWNYDLQGFEIQQGGIIVLTTRHPTKDVFGKIIDALAMAIAVHSVRKIKEMTFEFLYVSDRSRLVRRSDAIAETGFESVIVKAREEGDVALPRSRRRITGNK